MNHVTAISIATMLCMGLAARAEDEVSYPPIRIVITKTDCSRLLRHVPSADVAYKPGVDAAGRAVAPADIPGSGADAIPGLIPDVLEIPLAIKPMQGATYAKRGAGDSQAVLGTVRFDMAKGTFTFNDRPLTSPEQEELANACNRRGVR
ncbi:MAG TPA: hypothetical protein VK196_02435 [Magnetospirillum sp.]|nr:hypothetical protein [Magnetospirillum sp.]